MTKWIYHIVNVFPFNNERKSQRKSLDCIFFLIRFFNEKIFVCNIRKEYLLTMKTHSS